MYSLLEMIRVFAWGSATVPPITKKDEESLRIWLADNGYTLSESSVVYRVKRTTDFELKQDRGFDEVFDHVDEKVIVITQLGKDDEVFPFDFQDEGEILLEKYRIQIISDKYMLLHTRRMPQEYFLYEKKG